MGSTSWRIAVAATLVTAGLTTTSAQAPAPPPRPPAAQSPAAAAPSEETLGVPLYPNAVFLRSYDAGRGQRYYLFGVATPFADLVTYYRNILKDRGNLVFEVPPTHVFEIGRFREETMAFPPSVTIKDFTFSGSAGYPSPTPGTQPDRYPTIIQVVPPPPGTPPGEF
ncbi:MAG: hypothetical protein AB7U83_00880 [Vicinamibacterales bacterium]